ncbi:MAG: hypothetical protein HRT88_15570 [Lentisphaeraceae bacterium]|nr:hypothetical protein [Lentisphaeraceae bacterium]
MVIAILGILISMLLPTINKARKGSQAAVCASNQKQTGIAVIRWSIDNRGYLPHPHAGGENHKDGTENLAQLGHMKENIWYQNLEPYLGSKANSQLMRSCPALSYISINTNFTHFSFTPVTSGSNTRLVSVQYPARFLFFADGYPKEFDGSIRDNKEAEKDLATMNNNDVLINGAIEGHPNVSLFQRGSFDFRHQKKSNILFADGHVASQARATITRRLFRFSE